MRPATERVYQFISEHRERFGVVPICRALKIHNVQIAPRTFYAWCARVPSRRALWDITVTELLASCYQPDRHGRRPPESLYGAVKMWAHLRRQGVPVAKCTVARLMREHGWRGVRRDRRVRTTVSAGVQRAEDQVDRCFRAACPNRLFVADFTYVPIATGGFTYTAFVIDAFAGAIPGWHVSTRADTLLISRALADAVETRHRQGHPINPGAVHHSDAGTQYTSIAFGQHLADAGLRPSIGSVGDAYDTQSTMVVRSAVAVV